MRGSRAGFSDLWEQRGRGVIKAVFWDGAVLVPFKWAPRSAHTREAVEVSRVVGLASGGAARPFRALWFDAFRVSLLFVEISLVLLVSESQSYAPSQLRHGCPSLPGEGTGYRGMFGATTVVAFAAARGFCDDSSLEIADAIRAVEAEMLWQRWDHCTCGFCTYACS